MKSEIDLIEFATHFSKDRLLPHQVHFLKFMNDLFENMPENTKLKTYPARKGTSYYAMHLTEDKFYIYMGNKEWKLAKT